MRFSLLLAAAVCLAGCVSNRAALRYGRGMYDVGYATARTEFALESLHLHMKQSVLLNELRRRDEDAAEREQRSNPYADLLPPPQIIEIRIEDRP